MMRWYVKKAARAGLALSAWGTRLGRRPRHGSVRVLTYHDFGDRPRDPFCVHPDVFEAQMGWLAAEGVAVSLSQVERCRAGAATLPEGAVLVTIDDGLESLHAKALPILRSHRIPAVAFVTASDAERHLSWEKLREIAAAGIVVGSHSWTHRSLGRLTPREARDEVTRSREHLERHLGRSVTAFAYPYGTYADYDAVSARILREAGYVCAFTSQHGAVRPGADPFALPRVKVEGGESLWLFKLICRGALDGWRVVDRTLWRLQAT